MNQIHIKIWIKESATKRIFVLKFSKLKERPNRFQKKLHLYVRNHFRFLSFLRTWGTAQSGVERKNSNFPLTFEKTELLTAPANRRIIVVSNEIS